jgi:selenocysteine-specific elongation factor
MSAEPEGQRPMGGQRPLTIGTAGHVDHGKTALVAALTGVDTDRLPEEKARGLSIVLGYAPLRLPSGRQVSVVDVPGHERFVRTMVAGATGVDAFLMTIAADDGVMPQTVEHAQVLAALGVEQGVVAVTKADVADPAPAIGQARELLPGRKIVACSAKTGAGLVELRAALQALAGSLAARLRASGGARLHVDRVFTVKGRGTVVTGTLWSGQIAVEDTLELLPKGVAVRVRGVEVHGTPVRRADAGQRVAVNLRGIKPEEAARGDVLAQPGLLRERSVLDCALTIAAPRRNERVQVHHGTRAVPGRLRQLEQTVWRLRLERPLLACPGDRLVLRRHAPPQTLGGGKVIDVSPAVRPRRGGEALVSRLQRAATSGAHAPSAAARATRAPDEGAGTLDAALLRRVESELREAGTSLLSEAQVEDRLGGRSSQRDAPGAAAVLRTLREEGRAVRVSGRLYAHAASARQAREAICALIEREGPITLAQARDALGVGRKAAQALLEHLDATRVTRRLPDERRALAR